MRVKITTKDFGVVTTRHEPYSLERYEELITQMEQIGDGCHKEGNSYTFQDEKGNAIVLNPFILRNSVYMVELQPADMVNLVRPK
jgi:hypothetical protein